MLVSELRKLHADVARINDNRAPWRAVGTSVVNGDTSVVARCSDTADAACIAAAYNALPKLLALAESAKAWLDGPPIGDKAEIDALVAAIRALEAP